MRHKQVAMDATVTEQGRFEAIAAAWSIDRQNEQIVKGAFEDTLTAWRHQGRSVPIHWDHKGDAANVIGSVDPQTLVEADEGLVVEGQLDLETSEVAREAWRSMKAGRIALSFGYLVTSDFKRDDGVRELLGVDLFEISLTPSPANPDTRITSMKSARGSDELAGIFNDFLNGRSKTAYERQRMDREVEALAAELEAAKAARAVKSVRVHTFEV